MRVLYVCHPSSPARLSTDQTYGWATNFFRKWLDRDPNLSVYWTVPKDAPKKQREVWYKFTDEELENNIKLLEVDANITQVLEQSTFSPELVDLFEATHGKYYFDIMFCEKPAILPWFFNNTVIYDFRREQCLTVANIHYAISSKDNISVAYEMETAFYSSLLDCDAYQFVCTDRCDIDSYSKCVKNAKSHCSSTKLQKFKEKDRWVKLNSDIEELRDLYEASDKKKGHEFRVHFAFSTGNLYNLKPLIEILRKFKIVNKDLKLIVTTPSGSLGRGGKKPEDWMELYFQYPRQKFTRLALRSHCFVLWSVFSAGFNSGSAIEMARLGVLPIFHRNSIPLPWSEEWQDYPLVFEKEEELLALLKYVKNNYERDDIQGWIKQNQELIDSMNSKIGPDAIIDRVIDLHDKRKKRNPYTFYEPILKDLPDKISMSDLVLFIKENSDTKVDLDEITWVTVFKCGNKLDLRNHMISNGWEDIGDVNEVIFRRIKS